MNLIADRMEPYLRSSGITYVRNDPDRNVAGAIADSNAGDFDVHLAIHSNAAPESMAGMLRGIDVYYSPYDKYSETLAVIIANNFMSIYPLPDKCSAKPTTTLGEVTQTKAPAVLCEIGYHDNREDADPEQSDDNCSQPDPVPLRLLRHSADRSGTGFPRHRRH